MLLVIGSHGDRFHGDASAVRGTVANWSNVSVVSNTVEDVSVLVCDDDSCSAECEQGICCNRSDFEDWELDEIEVFGEDLTREQKINILLQLKASRRSNPWPDDSENYYSEHLG